MPREHARNWLICAPNCFACEPHATRTYSALRVPASAKEPLPRSHCVAGTAPTGWSWRNRSANQQPETGAADLEARHGGRSYMGQGACPAGRSRRRHAGGHLGGGRVCALDRCAQSVRWDKTILVGGGHTSAPRREGSAGSPGSSPHDRAAGGTRPRAGRSPAVAARLSPGRTAFTRRSAPLRRTEPGVPRRLRAGTVVPGRQPVGLAGLSDPSSRSGLTACQPAVTQISPGPAVWLTARPARHGATPRRDADPGLWRHSFI
jgi:hypothetical protein